MGMRKRKKTRPTPSSVDRLFEQHFTSYADRGVLVFARDLLLLLTRRCFLSEDETPAFIEYPKRSV